MRDMSEQLRRTSRTLIVHSQWLREHTARLVLRSNKLCEFAKRAAFSAGANRSHSDAAQKRQDER
jgi:hypothetical protein